MNIWLVRLGLISLVNDNHMDNNLKEILVYIYSELTVNNQPKNDDQICGGSWILIVFGFNDTSTLVGHFVSSPREREKRD